MQSHKGRTAQEKLNDELQVLMPKRQVLSFQ
jgi:hypothetical protein